MLHEAVVLGSHIYHQRVAPLRSPYDEFLSAYPYPLVNHPEAPNTRLTEHIIRFLNTTFLARLQCEPQHLLDAVQCVQGDLNSLRTETFLRTDLHRQIPGSETVGMVMARVFDAIARHTPRYQAVGASKILHLLHPQFFIMWDNRIAAGYAARDLLNSRSTANHYVDQFLPRVQLVARRAVAECRSIYGWTEEAAERSLCSCCGHTLAKVIDEYNYVKYTLGDNAVWEAELGPPSAP